MRTGLNLCSTANLPCGSHHSAARRENFSTSRGSTEGAPSVFPAVNGASLDAWLPVYPKNVMPGLDPGIHSSIVFQAAGSVEWIAGSSPAMTRLGRRGCTFCSAPPWNFPIRSHVAHRNRHGYEYARPLRGTVSTSCIPVLVNQPETDLSPEMVRAEPAQRPNAAFRPAAGREAFP